MTEIDPIASSPGSADSRDGSVSPTAYWDSLPAVTLSSCALREIDRRNKKLTYPKKTNETKTRDLARFARHGGPDLRHLRRYKGAMRSLDRTRTATRSTAFGCVMRARNDTIFDAASEQHLIELQIYPYGDGLTDAEYPENFEDIKQAMFAKADDAAAPKYGYEYDLRDWTGTRLSATALINILLWSFDICSRRDANFTVMEPLSNTHPERWPVARFFDGAPLHMLHDVIKHDEFMRRRIIPCRSEEVPVAPNFFLEVKQPYRPHQETVRQLSYLAAHGVRAMNVLQNFDNNVERFDGMAYTYSAVYDPSCRLLSLFAHYNIAPKTPTNAPTYHMKLVKKFALESEDDFVEAITALQNIRNLARRHRERFIAEANAKACMINANKSSADIGP